MKFHPIRNLALGLTTATLLATSAFAAPEPPPQLGNTQTTPVAAPYPDSALAHKQVEEAFRTAKKTHRKVLLDFGGNWCPDCRILAGIFESPKVEAWAESQFVIVPINVGRMNTNLDIAAQYGVKIKAVPTVLIVTPEGKLLDPDGTEALGNARAMSPQAAIDLIGQWNQRG